MSVIDFPQQHGQPTDRFRGENFFRTELAVRGFTIRGGNPADSLGDAGSHGNRCASGLRFAGMDLEASRFLGPNNMLGQPPDRWPIWAAFDHKGQQTARGPEFAISYRSYEGAIAFSNWRQCHSVFALAPHGGGVWIATIPHLENCPRGGYNGDDFIVSVLNCPTLDQWIADFMPYSAGRWGCPPPMALLPAA